MGLPSFTTIDKALVTGLGFVITVGGLVAKYGGLLHFPASWMLAAAGVVGLATTLLTYFVKGPEQAAREIAARQSARAQRKATVKNVSRAQARKTAKAVDHVKPRKRAPKPKAVADPVVEPHAPGVVEAEPEPPAPGKHHAK